MNAKQFTNMLEDLINSPTQKLVGNITTGYVTLNDEEVSKRCIMSSAISQVIVGPPIKIQKVIFNPPATIVLWTDGSKTIVKTQNNEIFDPEKGLAMAISKKFLGNKGRYFDEIKKWTKMHNG